MTLEDWETVDDGVRDIDVELNSVDLGRDSDEVTDGELDLDCREPGRACSGVVSSNLDLFSQINYIPNAQ